jgi:hypothetical protein
MLRPARLASRTGREEEGGSKGVMGSFLLEFQSFRDTTLAEIELFINMDGSLRFS